MQALTPFPLNKDIILAFLNFWCPSLRKVSCSLNLINKQHHPVVHMNLHCNKCLTNIQLGDYLSIILCRVRCTYPQSFYYLNKQQGTIYSRTPEGVLDVNRLIT